MVRYVKLQNEDQATVTICANVYNPGNIGNNRFGFIDWVILIFVYALWVATLPVSWCLSFKVIPQYERALIFRLGRLLPLKGPGLVCIIPGVDKCVKVDMRMRAFSVPPQEIYTIDGGHLKVGADVQYRVTDPIKSYGVLQDLDHSLRVSAQAALNKALAGKKIIEIDGERTFLSAVLQSAVNDLTVVWGIEIARFEIKFRENNFYFSVYANRTQVLILSEQHKRSPSTDDTEDPMATIMNVLRGLATPMPVGDALLTGGPDRQIEQNQSMLVPGELFEMLKVSIDAKIAHEVNAIFQFAISGELGGHWFIDLKSDPFIIGQGHSTRQPDVTFRLSDELFTKILYQKTTASAAYFTGGLVIDGDLRTAMTVETLLSNIANNSS